MKEEEALARQRQEDGYAGYRVVWMIKAEGGRWIQRERIEYAKSQSLAVNQALAKVRRDYPDAVVTGCFLVPQPAYPG